MDLAFNHFPQTWVSGCGSVMQVVLQTSETESRTSSSKQQREWRHIWNQRSVLCAVCLYEADFLYCTVDVHIESYLSGPHLCAGEQHPYRHTVLPGAAAVQTFTAHLWTHTGREQSWECVAEWVSSVKLWTRCTICLGECLAFIQTFQSHGFLLIGLQKIHQTTVNVWPYFKRFRH